MKRGGASKNKVGQTKKEKRGIIRSESLQNQRYAKGQSCNNWGHGGFVDGLSSTNESLFGDFGIQGQCLALSPM